MKLILLPTSHSGKWSLGLTTAFIILIWLKIQYGIPMMSFAFAALGLGGFFTGTLAIVKKRDKAILNFIPILVGLIIITWIIAEIAYPH